MVRGHVCQSVAIWIPLSSLMFSSTETISELRTIRTKEMAGRNSDFLCKVIPTGEFRPEMYFNKHSGRNVRPMWRSSASFSLFIFAEILSLLFQRDPRSANE